MLNPFIIGQRIYLRAPEPGDDVIIARSENHPLARETLFYALPTSIGEQHTKLIENTHDNKTIIFTIATIEPDEPIGITAFHRIDWVSRAAVFYIAIADEENWSQGYGSEATRLMVDYAFETLNLNRIQLHVSSENEKAVRAYEKTGFVTEGTLRQAMYNQNRYVDFLVMSILRQNYQKQKK